MLFAKFINGFMLAQWTLTLQRTISAIGMREISLVILFDVVADYRKRMTQISMPGAAD